MKTKRINLTSLRNEEHSQFFAEMLQLLNKLGTKLMNLGADHVVISSLSANEFEALQLIRKSATSVQIEEADINRDSIFRGLANSILSAQMHFNADKKEAARCLAVLMDQYGNVARRPYNDETAAIVKLVTEFNTTYAAQITLLGLNEWVSELNSRNLVFDNLMKNRYSEEADKTALRMKQVRTDIDAAFRSLLARIDALILINGPSNYETLVNEINVRIDKFNNIIAIRKGKAKSDETTPPSIDELLN